MSCRADLPVVLERWRRFRRALKAEEQPTMGVIMAALEKNGPAMFDNQDDPLEAAMGRRGEARDHRRAGRGVTDRHCRWRWHTVIRARSPSTRPGLGKLHPF